MLSLTDQLVPRLAKVLMAEDQQVKLATASALRQLVDALRVQFPQLFTAADGWPVAQ